jgi:hypothetical protein
MVDKILLATGFADFLFLCTGILELAYPLVIQSHLADGSNNGEDVVAHNLMRQFPLTAGIVNGAFIILTFVITLPGLFMTTRGWLKLAGYLVVFNALFTLCIGIVLWVMTLTVSEDFAPIYFSQTPEAQHLIQQSFNCCGYFNASSPAFVTDDVCPSPAAAALNRGCSVFISSFGGRLIDEVFTAVFGVVGVDAVFLLAIACLLKDRKEQFRYRHIDQKTGYW